MDGGWDGEEGDFADVPVVHDRDGGGVDIWLTSLRKEGKRIQ